MMVDLSARRWVLIGVATVAGLVLLLVALLIPLGRPDPTRVTLGGSPLFGRPAPEIDLATLAGERVRLSDLRGRPVLVNFWASTCIPCRDEFPLLVAAHERHREDGLEILGIVHDDSLDDARAFAERYGATWPLLDDPQDEAWEAYRGVGLPQSYFVDQEGIVRAFSLGPFTDQGLEAQLATIMPPAP